MSDKRLAGCVVNLLMFVYLALGVVVVLRESVALGIVYVALIFFSFVVVAYAWCGKCPCRFHSCTHIWLGKLSRLLFQREPGRYTSWDYVGHWVYVAGLHLLPQYWLWQNKVLFALFWALAFATLLVGPLYACKGCENVYCYLNKDQVLRIGGE